MQCKKFKKYFERYYDKTLSAHKQSDCEEHLKVCLKCRYTYDELNDIKPYFTQFPIPQLPINLTADIMRTVKNSIPGVKSHDNKNIFQWWNEAAIPVRLVFSVIFIIIITADIFMGKDLWNATDLKAYPEYTELDTFSDTPKGSLADIYLQLINTPATRSEK